MKRIAPASGMSLIEVIIALALTTMIAGLMGGIMRWYVVNQTRADYTYEELRMARAVLSMIADDIRCVLRNEPLDTKPLTALLQSSASSAMGGATGGSGAAGGAGAGGGGSGGGGQGGGGGGQGGGGGDTDQSGTGGAAGGGTGGGGAGGSAGAGGSGGGAGGFAGGGAGGAMGMSSSSSGSAGGSLSDSLGSMDGSSSSTLPPGVYGSETLLEVDISRVPRVDEAIIQQPDIMSGALSDLPTDVKTVSYYIQGNVTNGVHDSLSTLSSDVLGGNGSSVSSGLVRRIIARNVLQHAYSNSQSQQVMRTGTIISSDVVGLDFQYFDGKQWYTKWDSSTQGVPHVVRITIAMQNPTTPIGERMTPPISLSSISSMNLQASGITIYSRIVTIPGAALASGAASSDSASSAMGLTQ